MGKMSLIMMSLIISGAAYAACMKPTVPACATQAGPFSGVDDFDACRNQMIAYRDGIDKYLACQKESGQASSDEQRTKDELEQSLSKFNERARR